MNHSGTSLNEVGHDQSQGLRQNAQHTPSTKISWADESEEADQTKEAERHYIGSIFSIAPSSKDSKADRRPPDAIEAEVPALARGGCHPPVRRLTARGWRRPGHIRRGVIRLAGQSAMNQSHRSSTYKSSSDDLSEARPRGSDGLSQADCTLKLKRPWNLTDHTAGRVVWGGGRERVRQPLTYSHLSSIWCASKIVTAQRRALRVAKDCN